MVKKHGTANNSLTPRNRQQQATSLADTFKSGTKEKRTQLSMSVDESFRIKLSLVAKAKGVTQRDYVYQAVERLMEEDADLVKEYASKLFNK